MVRALLLFLLLSACASGPGRFGGGWIAVSASGDLRFGQPYPTLVIDGDRISGTAGCNRYSGRVSIEGEAFDASDIAVTEMACSPAIMEQERLFLTLLDDAVTVDPESGVGQLVLRAPDGRRLRLRSAPPQ